VEYDGDARLLHVRLRDVTLETNANAPGPLAASIREGRIDTSRPADLIGNMLGLPAFVADAAGDRVTIDLMALPGLDDDRFRAWVAVGTGVLGVTAIDVVEDAVQIRLSPFPAGIRAVLRGALRRVVSRESRS